LPNDFNLIMYLVKPVQNTLRKIKCSIIKVLVFKGKYCLVEDTAHKE